MNFEIKGLNDLMAKLDAIGASTAKAATAGVNRTLQAITSDAKDNAAVDTGQLRDSIQPYGDAHQAKSDGDVISGAAGTNAEHGPYVELGTGPVGEATPSEGKYPGSLDYTQHGWTYFDEKLQRFIHTNGQPAQPFLYPEYLAHREELSDNIKQAAEAELRGIAK